MRTTLYAIMNEKDTKFIYGRFWGSSPLDAIEQFCAEQLFDIDRDFKKGGYFCQPFSVQEMFDLLKPKENK